MSTAGLEIKKYIGDGTMHGEPSQHCRLGGRGRAILIKSTIIISPEHLHCLKSPMIALLKRKLIYSWAPWHILILKRRQSCLPICHQQARARRLRERRPPGTRWHLKMPRPYVTMPTMGYAAAIGTACRVRLADARPGVSR